MTCRQEEDSLVAIFIQPDENPHAAKTAVRKGKRCGGEIVAVAAIKNISFTERLTSDKRKNCEKGKNVFHVNPLEYYTKWVSPARSF